MLGGCLTKPDKDHFMLNIQRYQRHCLYQGYWGLPSNICMEQQ